MILYLTRTFSLVSVGPGYLDFKCSVGSFLMGRAIFMAIMVAEAENTAVYSFIHDLVNLYRDSTESSLRKLNN